MRAPVVAVAEAVREQRRVAGALAAVRESVFCVRCARVAVLSEVRGMKVAQKQWMSIHLKRRTAGVAVRDVT